MQRRHVLALGLSTVLAAGLPRLAQAQAITPEQEALIAEINAHNSAIRTMAGRFLQIDSQGGRAEGTFYIERPNRVRFRYNPPSREEIVSVGQGFYVLDRREETYYAYPQDSVPLRQFLGDQINLFNANIVGVTNSEDFIAVTITDDTPAGRVEVSLIFDVVSKDLTQWGLVEPSGAELTFSLYDIEKNVEIPRSFFYIDPTYRALEAAR